MAIDYQFNYSCGKIKKRKKLQTMYMVWLTRPLLNFLFYILTNLTIYYVIYV